MPKKRLSAEKGVTTPSPAAVLSQKKTMGNQVPCRQREVILRCLCRVATKKKTSVAIAHCMKESECKISPEFFFNLILFSSLSSSKMTLFLFPVGTQLLHSSQWSSSLLLPSPRKRLTLLCSRIPAVYKNDTSQKIEGVLGFLELKGLSLQLCQVRGWGGGHNNRGGGT